MLVHSAIDGSVWQQGVRCIKLATGDLLALSL